MNINLSLEEIMLLGVLVREGQISMDEENDWSSEQIDEPIDALAQEYDVEPDTIREWLNKGHKGSFEKEAPRYQYPIKTMPALIADITYRKNLAKVALDKLDKEMYTTPNMRLAQQKYEIYSNVVKLLNDLEPAEQAEKVELEADQQFVADWYEANKWDLEGNMFSLTVDIWEKGDKTDFEKWFNNGSKNCAVETLIKMKLYGYTVKPKRWVVKYESNGTSYYFTKWYQNNGNPFERNGSKEKRDTMVTIFTDKAKAEAVATLVEGSVEEID